MTMQMHRLVEYLQCLPISLISIDKIEADDTISYLAQKFGANGKKLTIFSCEKDFLQILEKNIEVYPPSKKKTYGKKEVLEEIGMIPENYLIMKALLGDNSDNLTGIKGLGHKTLLKEFPTIVKDPLFELNYIHKICTEKVSPLKYLGASTLVSLERVIGY